MANKTYKIVAGMCAVIAFAIIVSATVEACKTQKHIVQTSETRDSTALRQTHIRDSLAVVDSTKNFYLNRIFQINRNSELSIGKITKTEEETQKSAYSLHFNIDSLHAHGDTLSTVAHDGTKINIYANKKTGDIHATLKRKGGKKNTLSIENITLKSSENLDTSKTLQAAKTGYSATSVKDGSQTDSVTAKAQLNSKTKEVVRKDSFFSKIGIFIVLLAAVWIVIFAIKYWSKISAAFEAVKKFLGLFK